MKNHERTLKAEWWEVWWVKKGEKPVVHRAYGEPIPHWIPDHAFVTRESAFRFQRKQSNRYLKVIHVRRYKKVKESST